jgi:hypothetical protein
VQALDELAVAQRLEHLGAHAGHDPHVGHDVGRVGDLDPDLADRRADRAHRERDDVAASAPSSQPSNFSFRIAFISRGAIQLLVGPASAFAIEQM